MYTMDDIYITAHDTCTYTKKAERKKETVNLDLNISFVKSINTSTNFEFYKSKNRRCILLKYSFQKVDNPIMSTW